MIRAILRNAGIRPRQWLPSWEGWLRYAKQRKSFRDLESIDSFAWGKELPMLTEWKESSGSLGAYFFQDQLVARWIYEAAPKRHVDVGSRLDGFIGSLSVFRKVEVIDIRPQTEAVPRVTFHQVDLMEDLPESWIACSDSVSCLHTIEHFGLGRYGDPLDPNGHLKGIEQLKRMVAPSGLLYLSTPIGPQRVEFNAHRVFAPETLLSWFPDGWQIERCAVMNEDHQITESTEPGVLRNYRGNLGLGMVAARRMR